MNKLLDGMKKAQNLTFTENGAEALESTLNACLDMFGSFGAMRTSSEEEIERIFSKAFNEDARTAMRMLFYFRDVRGGQGIRRPFRVILKWLAENYPKFVLNNLDNIIFFGRGDDYLCLLDTSIKNEVADYLNACIKHDYAKYFTHEGDISLLAKWMPSENASSKETKRYAKFLISKSGLSAKEYRKVLTTLRAYLDVVEVKMSAKKWTDINYESVPSKAGLIYSDAFFNHDEAGYSDYIERIATGDAKVNAKALYPADLVHNTLYGTKKSRKDIILLDAMWKSLPNYFEGKEESSICVVDVSGSMSGTPMEVAVSLGLYCADKCKGPFKDHFITFSANPKLQKVTGGSFTEKVNNICDSDWDMNTDIEAVFDLILETAVANNCTQEDIPAKLYIISDMQFDSARMSRWGKQPTPFMQQMKQKFIDAGYVMPSIVYWNVRASECGMFQETFEGENCCMVSGYSPSLFKSIMEGTEYVTETVTTTNSVTGESVTTTTTTQKLDPMTIMNTTINNERYDCVWFE